MYTMMRPITERLTAIHACRSIRAASVVTHKQNAEWRLARGERAAPDHVPDRPKDDSERGAVIPANLRASIRVPRLPGGNKPNRSVENDSRKPIPPKGIAMAKSVFDSHE